MELAEDREFRYVYYTTKFLTAADHDSDGRMLKNIKIAVHMKAKSQAAFESFNQRFPPDVVAAWNQLVDAWDKDQTQKNPYEEPTASKFYPREVS